MDGLIMLVADHLKLNPTSGQLFLFRNRHANKIKVLWWERNGFWLCYKRLEQGRLKFPPQLWIKNQSATLLGQSFHFINGRRYFSIDLR